jgi:CheY-like chemotaxis protein/predicted regulator of Ras-like GTPase activity (Roadblock/LC7/MglB family)
MTSERLLIVHWQETFIEACTTWLESEGYEIQTAFTGEAALNSMRSGIFDLVVAPLDLPDRDGLSIPQFLREEIKVLTPVLLLSREVTLPVDLVDRVTAFDNVKVIAQPSEAGPFMDAIWELQTVDFSGIRGNVRDINLPGLITMLCNEGLRAALNVVDRGQQAQLYFERGELVHAEVQGREPRLTGEDAVYEALTWGEGRFNIRMGESAPDHTIETSWAGVLLEGLRRADEESFDQEQLLPEDDLLADDPLSMSSDFLDAPPPQERRKPTFAISDDLQSRTEQRIQKLYSSLNLRFALLTDRSGRLIALSGRIKHSRALSLAALIAGSFSATAEVAEMIAVEGEESRFTKSLQESETFSLYTMQAGPSWILALTFEPEQTNLGLARLYMSRAIEDLEALYRDHAVPDERQQEAGASMNDAFREEVGQALENIFG